MALDLQYLANDVLDAQECYSGLSLILSSESKPIVYGAISIDHTHHGHRITSQHFVGIKFPEDYPQNPPYASDLSGRMEQDFHLNYLPHEHFCLAAPVEVKRIFLIEPAIQGFMDRLVIPYLFAHDFKKKYGYMPFGELAHGLRGIMDYYNCQFGTTDNASLRLLDAMTCSLEEIILRPCPCGKPKPLKKCHGDILSQLQPLKSKEGWCQELLKFLREIQKYGFIRND